MRGLFPVLMAIFVVGLSVGAFGAERVKTESGVVEGKTSSDGRVQIFEGIPFAAPPVGNLRWKAPQPVKPWTGTKSAKEFGPIAPQTPMPAGPIKQALTRVCCGYWE